LVVVAVADGFAAAVVALADSARMSVAQRSPCQVGPHTRSLLAVAAREQQVRASRELREPRRSSRQYRRQAAAAAELSALPLRWRQVRTEALVVADQSSREPHMRAALAIRQLKAHRRAATEEADLLAPQVRAAVVVEHQPLEQMGQTP
jgi:hypothetical protein